MRKLTTLFSVLSLILLSASCEEEYPDLQDGLYAEINTNYGTMVTELYYEAAPMTVANFVSLAEGTNEQVTDSLQGKPYFDGLTFHRIVPDFVIQGGDPTGTGTGGPGYSFPDELVDTLSHDKKGILSMANSGPNTNGSQFFITLKPTPNLDPKHSIFGELVKGEQVLDSIAGVETGAQGRPMQEVTMNTVNIIRKGKEAKNWDAAAYFNDAFAKANEAKDEMVNKFEEWKKEAVALDSGTSIYYKEKGDGPKPERGAQVEIDYAGYLADGKLFDTSKLEVAERMNNVNQQKKEAGFYKPMPVKIEPEMRMIPGFRDALLEMNYGDKAVVFIPADQGYGPRPVPQAGIPANADLVFEIDMPEAPAEAQ